MKNKTQELAQTNSNAYLCLSTAPSMEIAKKISEELLQQKLVACVNMLEGVTSMYHWQGNIECEQEVQLLMKTQVTKLDELKSALLMLHPYDAPEFIAVKISDGLPVYLNWIQQTLVSKQ
jgi:periplasmic divalent cation tolerance protein